MDGWNTTFLLEWPIFRGYVSFREGKICDMLLYYCVNLCKTCSSCCCCCCCCCCYYWHPHHRHHHHRSHLQLQPTGTYLPQLTTTPANRNHLCFATTIMRNPAGWGLGEFSRNGCPDTMTHDHYACQMLNGIGTLTQFLLNGHSQWLPDLQFAG